MEMIFTFLCIFFSFLYNDIALHNFMSNMMGVL